MRKLSGWQKAGLFVGVGCFSIVAVLVLGVVVAVFWARATLAELGDPNPTRVERTIDLQGPEPAPAAAGASRGVTTPGGPLRLEIDLEEGVFVIDQGPPGSQVTVEGTYAQGLYDLTEDHEADAAGSGRRTTVRFRSKAPGWARMLAGVGEGAGRPTVTVRIPEGIRIDLSLRVSLGESRIDLGGLTLSDLGLDLSMGTHQVEFSEPLGEGLRRIQLNARMGDISVDKLGNAGAQTIDASGSMGNLKADLGGAWARGVATDVSFTHSMGQLTLNVPAQLRLDTNISSLAGPASNRPAGAETTTDPDAPLVRLRMSTTMGESRVSRY
jgi:hypothetical protein